MNDEATRFNPRNAQRISPGTLLLGTYTVERPLDAGGMATTYLTHHRELNNTKHVIKVIKSEFTSNLADAFELTHSEAGNKSIALLKAEAEALLSIHHDAIVGFQGFQKDAVHGHCLIMEYVEGPSLKDFLKQNTLTIPQFWQLRNRLAGGLAAAHAKGIFHRDISPDNVLLPDGKIEEAKLIDFGIAKQQKPTSDGTIFGSMFVGKYAYAAPEQFEGGTVGAYSDLYSLGLVLAEAVIGKRLNMGNSEESAKMARHSVPNFKSIPVALRPQFNAMLQPKPSDRPQSMLALLQRWPYPPKAKQWPEKLSKGWIAGLSVALVAIIGFGLLQFMPIQISFKALPPPPQTPLKIDDLSATKPSIVETPRSTTNQTESLTINRPETLNLITPTVKSDAPAVKQEEEKKTTPAIETAKLKEPKIDPKEQKQKKILTSKNNIEPLKSQVKEQKPTKPTVVQKPKKSTVAKIIAAQGYNEPLNSVPKKSAPKKAGSNCARLREKESFAGEMGFANLTANERAYLNTDCP
ncbi:MAG: protein kinase [Methylococcaceae bacterium]|nr:protein kinase [Methylococcaceae bacterium]